MMLLEVRLIRPTLKLPMPHINWHGSKSETETSKLPSTSYCRSEPSCLLRNTRKRLQ